MRDRRLGPVYDNATLRPLLSSELCRTAPLAFDRAPHPQFVHMVPPGPIRISEVLLSDWAMSCVRIDHLGTLIQNELRPSGKHLRAIDMAERAARSALTLRGELHLHGARYSNACIANPQSVPIPADLPNQWAETCIQIYNLGNLIKVELPRERVHRRAIDLAGRIARRALTMHNELLRHGAEGTGPVLGQTG